MKLNHLILVGALLAPGVYAETAFNDTPAGETASPPAQLTANPLGENTERQLPPDAVFNLWVQDETFFKPHEDDRIEVEKVLDKKYETFKLKDAVPPIGFRSGEADIPESAVTQLREVLQSMKRITRISTSF